MGVVTLQASCSPNGLHGSEADSVSFHMLYSTILGVELDNTSLPNHKDGQELAINPDGNDELHARLV